MFRKARIADIDRIVEIYDAILTLEEAGELVIGWQRGLYPTRETAMIGLNADDLFVLEEDGRVIAAARINNEQMDSYALAHWKEDAPAEQVMVLHTLVVDPAVKGRGHGARFVQFYCDYALEQGCPYLRMDTYPYNARARGLYKRMGFAEVDIIPWVEDGRDLLYLCLEKTLK